jgi:dTDP-4-dehydrorhamnose reductase
MARCRKQQITIALIGSKGMLASAVQAAASESTIIIGLDLPEFDLTQTAAATRQLLKLQPDIIINCAAFTQVDRCETEEQTAMLVNGAAVGMLAETAKELDATLVHISTDYVFDGHGRLPYVETDPPNPLSAYGRSKLAGEAALIGSGLKRYYLIRTSWLYGPNGQNFVETILRLAGERPELRIVKDQLGSPTLTCDLAAAIFRLLAIGPKASQSQPEYGLYHYSGSGLCSWYDFACEIIRLAQQQGIPLKVEQLLPITSAEYPLPAPRPAYSVLAKEKYLKATKDVIPTWQESLAGYFSMR